MKVLLIGPIPPPVTGVSLANKIVLDYLPVYENINVDFINTNLDIVEEKEKIGKFSLNKLVYYSKQYLYTYKTLYVDKVYITIGQTFFGVLKYFPFFFIAHLLNKEIIVHIHGNHVWKEYEELTGIKKRIYHKILSFTDKGIVLSKTLIKNFTPFISKKKIYVLYNFVEDFLFENSIKKKYDKLRMIFFSNLMKEKGILEFLEALKVLKKKNVSFEAKIAGGVDPLVYPIIKRNIEQLGKEVSYEGVVLGKNKRKLLEWGNVFVLPTKFDEGQPISILESMALGNVILSTRTGGVVDIIEEGVNGFFIHKNSVDSIVERLLFLQENILLMKTISKNNIEEAKEKYKVKSFIDNLSEIIYAKTFNF